MFILEKDSFFINQTLFKLPIIGLLLYNTCVKHVLMLQCFAIFSIKIFLIGCHTFADIFRKPLDIFDIFPTFGFYNLNFLIMRNKSNSTNRVNKSEV